MAQAPRISVADARDKAKRNQALLVCAYDDEAKCSQLALEGAISHAELQRRLPSLPKTQELIFYCA